MTIILNVNDSSLNLTIIDKYTVTSNSSSWGLVRASEGKSKGKWYWEITLLDIFNGATSTNKRFITGISSLNQPNTSYNGSTSFGRGWQPSNMTLYKGNAQGNGTYGNNVNVGDVISVLLDMDIGTLEFWINGTSQGVAYSDLKPLIEVFATESLAVSGASLKVNYGKEEFQHVIPSGYTPYDSKKRMIITNNSTQKNYSLDNKTLIFLPDSSDKNMILHGIEADKEIKLDEDFDKMKYVQDVSEVLGDGKTFTHAIDISKTKINKINL